MNREVHVRPGWRVLAVLVVLSLLVIAPGAAASPGAQVNTSLTIKLAACT